MAKSYYEFKDKSSSKFWEVETKGKKVTVRFGKIGTDGQVTVKSFATPFEAAMYAAKAESEKTKKGYKQARPNTVGKATKRVTPKSKTVRAAKAADRPAEDAEMSADITIRFALTKGEGHFPDITQFSDAELRDMKSCVALSICWDPDAAGLDEDTKITGAEILYDGLSPLPREEFGYRVTRESVSGYPAPVVRFHLNRPVPPEQFRKAVWTSCVDVQTAAMADNDEEPFFAEDYNGYSSVLSPDNRDDLVRRLKRHRLLSGHALRFRDGMPTGGYRVPGPSFVVKCGLADRAGC